MDLANIFLHLDVYLTQVLSQYGIITYIFLFIVIFMETGFVVTPFLPGDSLLFAAGAISTATGSFNIYLLYPMLVLAAILGDTVNYWIGHSIGPKIFEIDHRFIKKKYLIKTQEFYAKHGGKAIILARFVPIIRTFAPFVAGVTRMDYKYFIKNNIIGGVAWVTLFVWTGYLFGNLQFVKDDFHYIVLFIIILSVLPIVYEVLKSKFEKSKNSV